MTAKRTDAEPSYSEERRAWADGHMPLVLDVIKNNLHRLVQVRSATETEDVTGFDLSIGLPERWMVRVRRRKYWELYGDVTLRIPRGESEISKIESGAADWMFYGWINDEETDWVAWLIIDLAKLGPHVSQHIAEIRRVPGNVMAALDLISLVASGAVVAMSVSVAEKIAQKWRN